MRTLSAARDRAGERRESDIQSRNYTYVGISLNELSGLKLTCTAAQRNSQGACPISTGEQTIASLGFDKFSIRECALVLVAMIIFFRACAYLAIRFIKW